MSSPSSKNECSRADGVCMYAMHVLPAGEARELESHLNSCESCREQLANLRPVVDSFTSWPVALLRPSPSLWDQLLTRISDEGDREIRRMPAMQHTEPAWEEVAGGISCKMLSSDLQEDRVCMLVQLTPGTEYPPHRHAGVEELYLLEGELWIDDRKLFPGDYNKATAGTADNRVWSDTGCTCLLITSPSDLLS